MLRELGEAEWTLYYYVFLWPIGWANAAPWRALVIAGVLFVYCALVRLMLERMHARLFDISSAAAIILWISFLPYEVFMQAWEKTVVAPIRVDLLLVAVVLNIATGICVASSMWALFQKLRTMWCRRR